MKSKLIIWLEKVVASQPELEGHRHCDLPPHPATAFESRVGRGGSQNLLMILRTKKDGGNQIRLQTVRLNTCLDL